MTWAKLQGTTVKTSTSTTLANNAWASAPTVGSVLVMPVLVNRSSAATSANAVTGWIGPLTLSPSNESVNGTRHVGFYIYYRIADGNNTAGHDAAPSVTISANTGAVSWCDELSGNDQTTPFEIVGLLQTIAATSGTATPAVTTANDGDYVYSVLGGNSGVVPTVVWGGGATADRAIALFNASLYYASGAQVQTTHGVASPTAAVSGIGSTGLPIIGAVSVAFKAPGAPSSGTVRKIRQAGAWVTAIRKIRQSGSFVTATRKIRQSGTWV